MTLSASVPPLEIPSFLQPTGLSKLMDCLAPLNQRRRRIKARFAPQICAWHSHCYRQVMKMKLKWIDLWMFAIAVIGFVLLNIM